MEDDAQEPVQQHLEDRLKYALESHNKILNRLWIGNGGGAAVVVTALHPQEHLVYLFPLGFFVLGVVFLGVGAFEELRWVHAELKSIEEAAAKQREAGEAEAIRGSGRYRYLLHIPMKFFLAPSEQAWLTWTDWGAMGTFVMGVIAGFIAGF
jgi:hypothetical protein